MATKKTAKSDKTRSDKTKNVSARKPPVAGKPAVEKTPSPKTQARPFSAEGDGRGTTNGSGQLRVRMYRVGFGDFFLLTVPSTQGPLHVLIDCGVTKGKTGKGDIGTIKDAVADMAAYTGGKLALIIVTHRHMDHIIGFSRCAEFQNFKGKVEAIWMPIWEKEYDSEINKFQEEITALALDLQSHLAAAADNMPDGPEMLAMLENAIGPEMGMAGTGGGTNAASLNLLKHGLDVEPKYYHKGQTPELPKPLVDAGLAAEILGPPPPDATAFMKLMDLKKGVGQYLDTTTGASANSKRFRPFRTRSEGKASDHLESAFWEWDRRDEEKGDPNYSPSGKLEKAVNDAQPAVLLTAVQQLDKFLNNQSLVVLFTFESKKLLFAGDAQAGNWEYWLYGGDQPTKTPSDKLGDKGKQVLGKLLGTSDSHFYGDGTVERERVSLWQDPEFPSCWRGRLLFAGDSRIISASRRPTQFAKASLRGAARLRGQSLP